MFDLLPKNLLLKAKHQWSLFKKIIPRKMKKDDLVETSVYRK